MGEKKKKKGQLTGKKGPSGRGGKAKNEAKVVIRINGRGWKGQGGGRGEGVKGNLAKNGWENKKVVAIDGG